MGHTRTLPAWLEEAVGRALHDLQQPTEVPVRLGYAEDSVGQGMLTVEEIGEQSSMGVWVPAGERGAELVVRSADELQEQFFPESRGAWGELAY